MPRLARTWACPLALACLLLGACGDDAGDDGGSGGSGATGASGGGGSDGGGGNTGICQEGNTRCVDGVEQRCTGGEYAGLKDCVALGQVCRDSGDGGACVDLAWTQLGVTIDDPIVNGTSLMVPIDAISFGYDPAGDLFVTAFDRDFNQPSNTFFWHLDGASGVHTKKPLSGSVFPDSESFCVGGEDWCQLIGFDPQSSEWVLLGPSTSGMMRVGSNWTSSITAVTGSQPPDSHINRSHRFAWSARRLFLYGSTGPSSFGDSVYAFDLDAASWTVAVSGLPQVDDNCLAYDDESGTLYSVGGQVTTDGGNTTETLDSYAAIDVAAGSQTTLPLPSQVGPRRAISCAFDPGRRVLYVYAGSVVNDYWDEALNEYHNDLWALDIDQVSWTQLIADGESGVIGPPDGYGDHPFEGYPEGPNFGQNRGHLEYDEAHDRLIIIGAVPIFTHEQIYFLDLDGVEQLL